MAVNITEEGISHGTLTQSVQGIQESSPGVRHTDRPKRKWPFRCFGSNSIVIILAWSYIMTFCLHLKENIGKEYVSQLGKETVPEWLIQFIYYTAFAVSCPVASLLAEVVVGRYKFICYTLRVQWLFFFAGAVITVGAYCLPIPSTASYIIGYYIVAIPVSAFHGAFLAVVVPLGLDQIAGGSNRNISPFISWFLWSICSGYGTADILVPVLYNCTKLKKDEATLVLSLLPVLLLSVGLILDFHFHHKLVKEPVTVNPVSLIFKVFKYAAKHKYPVQRSAFTYCENEQPTRLDYGKSKYGGPFTTEQVEDVKTFWRILVVMAVMSMLYGPTESMYASYPVLKSQFHSYSHSNCLLNVLDSVFVLSSFTVYIIPLYELLINPCLRNRGPSILQTAGIGAAATICTARNAGVHKSSRGLSTLRTQGLVNELCTKMWKRCTRNWRKKCTRNQETPRSAACPRRCRACVLDEQLATTPSRSFKRERSGGHAAGGLKNGSSLTWRMMN